MSVVQTEYGNVKPTPARQSIWLVIDDPPCDDIEALKEKLKAAVGEVLKGELDVTTAPQLPPVAAGVAETDKLSIWAKLR